MFRLSSLAFRTAWWSVSGHRVNQALYHKSCGQSFLSVSTQEYKKLFFFFPCHTVCALGDLDQGFERASVKCWLCPGLSWYALKYQFHSLADFFKLASKIHLYTSPAPFLEKQSHTLMFWRSCTVYSFTAACLNSSASVRHKSFTIRKRFAEFELFM